MILDDLIDIKLSASNYRHYQSLGYKGKIGEIIKVFPKDLQDGTSTQEERQCDCCGKRYKRRHSQHLKSFQIRKLLNIHSQELLTKKQCLNMAQINQI